MSLYDYCLSLEISKHDPSFYALIISAMRKADTTNMYKLRTMWPELYDEFKRRYHAPGGILPEDSPIPEGSGPCSVCQTGTTYCGEHNGDSPVWLCPDHGGAL